MSKPATPVIRDVRIEVAAQELRMNRWKAILYIVFCFEMGAFLFIFPWVSVWANNFFVGHYVWVSAVARNYYVRGAVSGLGLADVFLAFSEAWRLRHLLGLVHSRTVQ